MCVHDIWLYSILSLALKMALRGVVGASFSDHGPGDESQLIGGRRPTPTNHSAQSNFSVEKHMINAIHRLFELTSFLQLHNGIWTRSFDSQQ